MGLFGVVGNGLEAEIDFDARDDAEVGDELGEGFAVVGELASGFVEEDDAREIIGDVWGSEEDIAVIAADLFFVGDVSGGEFLGDGAAGFVGGEDAFAWGEELGGSGADFGLGGGFNEVFLALDGFADASWARGGGESGEVETGAGGEEGLFGGVGLEEGSGEGGSDDSVSGEGSHEAGAVGWVLDARVGKGEITVCEAEYRGGGEAGIGVSDD